MGAAPNAGELEAPKGDVFVDPKVGVVEAPKGEDDPKVLFPKAGCDCCVVFPKGLD